MLLFTLSTRIAWLLALLLATFTDTSYAKRGGGGGDSSTGGDGEDSGGDSGGSSEGDNDASGQGRLCPDIQDDLRHFGPVFSSYYDGILQANQRITGPPDILPREGSNTTQYAYSATLKINGYLDPASGRFVDIGWSLRAYQTWDRDFNFRTPLREVFSLSRYVYPYQEAIIANGTRDMENYSFESWDIADVKPSRNENGTVTGIDFTSRLLRNPGKARYWDGQYPSGNSYEFPRIFAPADNWITLNDISALGYEFDSLTVRGLPTGRSSAGYLATIFLQPNVSDMTASIKGVGTSGATFDLSGAFEEAFGGGFDEWSCYTSNITRGEADDKGYVSDDWEPYHYDSTIYGHLWWNASGTFDLHFAGKLNPNVSRQVLGFENDTFIPIWSESGALAAVSLPRLLTVFSTALCSFLVLYI